MATLDDATRKQLANIEAASGRSIPEWFALVRGSGLTRAGEIRTWLTDEHGLTYGNATSSDRAEIDAGLIGRLRTACDRS